MKHLSEFILSPYDSLASREETEWLNYWYGKANSLTRSRRILFIGDSTARMVRGRLESRLGIPVDFIGTSSGLHDVLFVSQVDAFFSSKRYSYAAIMVQLGQHSIKNEKGEVYTESDYIQFRQDILGLVLFLKQFSPNIILLTCFLSVAPYPRGFQTGLKRLPIRFLRRIIGEVIDDSWSNVVANKNKIILDVAREGNIPCCDIDGYMRNLSEKVFPRLVHDDHIHYEPRARRCIVDEYIRCIHSCLDNSL